MEPIARLSSLPPEVLGSFMELVTASDFAKLVLSGCRVLRMKLLERPVVRSLRIAQHTLPASEHIVQFMPQLRFLQTLSIVVQEATSRIATMPELKLGALPSSLTSIRLEYPLSFFALVSVPSSEIHSYLAGFSNLTGPLTSAIREFTRIKQYDTRIKRFNPRTFLFNLRTILPQIQMLSVKGVGNADLFPDDATQVATPDWIKFFLESLPLSLATLDTDWIHAQSLARYLPPSVHHATVSLHLSADQAQLDRVEWTPLLSRLQSLCISPCQPRFGISSLPERVASQPQLHFGVTHYSGHIGQGVLLAMPRLTFLDIPSLDELDLAAPSLVGLVSLTVKNWTYSKRVSSVKFPANLKTLVMRDSVLRSAADVAAFPKGLTRLEIGTMNSDELLDCMPTALRHLWMNTATWTGKFLAPNLVSFPDNHYHSWGLIYHYFRATFNPNVCIETKYTVLNITQLPKTMTNVWPDFDLSRIPLVEMPPHINTLGRAYPLAPHELDDVPRHITSLGLPKTTVLTFAQFRLLPLTIQCLTGGIFVYDTAESIVDTMERISARKSTSFQIPGSFSKLHFNDPSTLINPRKIQVHFAPSYFEILPDCVDSVTVDTACWKLLETNSSAEIPPTITRFTLLNFPSVLPDLLSRLHFPPTTTFIGLFGQVKLGEDFEYFKHLPATLQNLELPLPRLNPQCVAHLPTTLTTLLNHNKDKMKGYRIVFQRSFKKRAAWFARKAVLEAEALRQAEEEQAAADAAEAALEQTEEAIKARLEYW